MIAAKKKGRINHMAGMALCLMISIVLACAGCASTGQVVTTDQMSGVENLEGATIELVKKEQPLEGVGAYAKIRVTSFAVSDEYTQDYARELKMFHVALISDLRTNGAFKNVLEGTAASRTGKTVNVTGKIVEMRITSGAARFWGSWMAGASYMTVCLKITDAVSGKILKEKIISTHNNPYAAAWAGGSSDRSLPADMGQIIAAYLSAIIPTA